LYVTCLKKAVQLNPEDASAPVHLAETYHGLSSFGKTQKDVCYGRAANWRRK
jgi:hypothetical protein